jgi:hypothetical protein
MFVCGKTRLEMLARDKQPYLIRKFVNYFRKMFYGIGTRYARTSELSGKLSVIPNSEFSTKIEPRKILIKLYFVTEKGYIRIVLLIYNIRLYRNKWLIKTL